MKFITIFLVLLWTFYSSGGVKIDLNFENRTLGILSPLQCGKEDYNNLYNITKLSELNVPSPKTGNYVLVAPPGVSCLQSDFIQIDGEFYLEVEYLSTGNDLQDTMEIMLEDRSGHSKSFKLTSTNGEWKKFKQNFPNEKKKVTFLKVRKKIV